MGAGKVDLGRYIKNGSEDFICNVDRCYSDGLNIGQCEDEYLAGEKIVYCQSDLFNFADSFKFKFDLVICERIFEHMEYLTGEVGRLLEAINTLTFFGAKLEIVVPNALLIAKKLQNLEKWFDGMQYSHSRFMNELLLITSENHNIRLDPHLSTWTPKLAKFYIEREGIFNVELIKPQITFAGRDIYMKIICKKK